jgi:putative DNA primase/helicase
MADDKPKLRIVSSLESAETLSEGGPTPPLDSNGKADPKTGGDAVSEKGMGAGASADDGDIDLSCAFLPRTDLGNAERFIKRHGDSFLYVEQWGWLAWDGKRWNIHEADAILARAVHQTIKDIRREAKAYKASEFDFFIEKKKGAEIWDSDKLVGWCLASQSSPHISCVARIVQSHLTASSDSFDADPMAMNVDNGTLRFAVHDSDDYVTFHPHRRADRMTKITPVAFDKAAASALYDKFLNRVQPDDKMQRHLHAWGGVSLTGRQVAKLSFWYGTGRNGKSTLTDIWAHVMGDYAQTIPIESFLDQGRTRRGGEASPDIAALPGVRCLRTSEPEKGSKLAESLVKLVTGGEPLRARHLNRDFFEFRPVFKLTMQGNYKPRIDGTDEGMWARMLLVPWMVMIPEEERDTSLPDKLRAEAPGILNRLLDGLRYYMDHGLTPPDEVIEATAEYRDDSDPIGRFLKECVVLHPEDPAKRVAGLELYLVYKAWCKTMGERRWSPKSFSRGLQDHGIIRLKSSQIFYLGIEMGKHESDFSGQGFEEEGGGDRNRR